MALIPVTCDNPKCIQPNQVLAYRTPSYGESEYYCSPICYKEANDNGD